MSEVRLEGKMLTCVRILLCLLLLVPIGAYISIFGFSISANHARWGEMGSAMSGIYGPILTVLTLAVLVVQVRMQSESNKHVYDQAHLQLAQADLTFYLCRLEAQLNAPVVSGVAPAVILRSFMVGTLEELRNFQLRALAVDFNRRHSTIIATWQAVLSIYRGLLVVNEEPYKQHLTSGKLRAISILSYEVCAALDNCLWSSSEGQLDASYFFGAMQQRT